LGRRDSSSSWSIKGVSESTKAAAREAARSANMTLGEWLALAVENISLSKNEHKLSHEGKNSHSGFSEDSEFDDSDEHIPLHLGEEYEEFDFHSHTNVKKPIRDTNIENRLNKIQSYVKELALMFEQYSHSVEKRFESHNTVSWDPLYREDHLSQSQIIMAIRSALQDTQEQIRSLHSQNVELIDKQNKLIRKSDTSPQPQIENLHSLEENILNKLEQKLYHSITRNITPIIQKNDNASTIEEHIVKAEKDIEEKILGKVELLLADNKSINNTSAIEEHIVKAEKDMEEKILGKVELLLADNKSINNTSAIEEHIVKAEKDMEEKILEKVEQLLNKSEKSFSASVEQIRTTSSSKSDVQSIKKAIHILKDKVLSADKNHQELRENIQHLINQMDKVEEVFSNDNTLNEVLSEHTRLNDELKELRSLQFDNIGPTVDSMGKMIDSITARLSNIERKTSCSRSDDSNNHLSGLQDVINSAKLVQPFNDMSNNDVNHSEQKELSQSSTSENDNGVISADNTIISTQELITYEDTISYAENSDDVETHLSDKNIKNTWEDKTPLEGITTNEDIQTLHGMIDQDSCRSVIQEEANSADTDNISNAQRQQDIKRQLSESLERYKDKICSPEDLHDDHSHSMEVNELSDIHDLSDNSFESSHNNALADDDGNEISVNTLIDLLEEENSKSINERQNYDEDNLTSEHIHSSGNPSIFRNFISRFTRKEKEDTSHKNTKNTEQQSRILNIFSKHKHAEDDICSQLLHLSKKVGDHNSSQHNEMRDIKDDDITDALHQKSSGNIVDHINDNDDDNHLDFEELRTSQDLLHNTIPCDMDDSHLEEEDESYNPEKLLGRFGYESVANPATILDDEDVPQSTNTTITKRVIQLLFIGTGSGILGFCIMSLVN